MKQKISLPFYRKKSFMWLAAVACVVLLIMLAFRLSPWPGALIIRMVFNQNGGETLKAMEAALPDYPVTVLRDEQYREGDKAARLDVYIPNSAIKESQKLPIVIWTHGGAWISGDKKDAAPYYSRLASQGYTVISLNYSLAPGKTYPTAVRQLNNAYSYIQANASRFYANPDKIVLGGDSAGAQLASQMATIITNPAYAERVGIAPSLQPAQLAAVVLYCGIYKMEGLVHPDPTLPKIVGWGTDVAAWAYTGSRDHANPNMSQMSAFYHVTAAFPATFISGGNGDPLTKEQSVPFSEELQSLGVPVTTLFYPADHLPSLPHEYQFTFNNDGETAFAKMLQFLQARTKE